MVKRILTIVNLSLALVLWGCGAKKSDPTGKYPEVKDSVKEQAVLEQRQLLIERLFMVRTTPANLDFVAGEEKTVTIEVLYADPEKPVPFTVNSDAESLLQGSTWQEVPTPTAFSKKFSLTWKPEARDLGKNLNLQESFHLSFAFGQTTDPFLAKTLKQIHTDKEIKYQVFPSQNIPQIEIAKIGESETWPNLIKEGESFDFTVRISGEGVVGKDLPPEEVIDVPPAEKAYIDATGYVELLDNPAPHFKDGFWQYHFRFTAPSVISGHLGTPNATSIVTAFRIQTRSQMNRLRVVSIPQIVKIAFQPTTPIVMASGTTSSTNNKMTAKVQIIVSSGSSSRGKISIYEERLKENIKGLTLTNTQTKSLQCSVADPLNCTLTFTADCPDSIQSLSFDIPVIHQIGSGDDSTQVMKDTKINLAVTGCSGGA